jgi:hypothetical protein
LQPGEKIVWTGKPDPWWAANRRIFPLAFMTLWTGGILFAAWHAFFYPTKPKDGVDVLIIMIAFGAFGWYRAFRLLLACWATSYALTDRRLIIAERRDTQSFTAAALGIMTRTGDARRGSLMFDASNTPSYSRRSFFYAPGLYGIADPARVEALIYKTLIMPNKEGVAG